mmetsp:Transcript_78201/g.95742  ORF Transcript_78201/g.95742 Transcript_78201/m.95742 type:complete len:267 (-) Transcript_78201:63-863(-)
MSKRPASLVDNMESMPAKKQKMDESYVNNASKESNLNDFIIDCVGCKKYESKYILTIKNIITNKEYYYRVWNYMIHKLKYAHNNETLNEYMDAFGYTTLIDSQDINYSKGFIKQYKPEIIEKVLLIDNEFNDDLLEYMKYAQYMIECDKYNPKKWISDHELRCLNYSEYFDISDKLLLKYPFSDVETNNHHHYKDSIFLQKCTAVINDEKLSNIYTKIAFIDRPLYNDAINIGCYNLIGMDCPYCVCDIICEYIKPICKFPRKDYY